jgi:transposase
VGPQGRDRREQIRRLAARMFADGMSGTQVAAELEISTKSAYAWRRAWKAGGENALASKGTPGPDPVLSEQLVQKLIVKLNEGPAAAGWAEDPAASPISTGSPRTASKLCNRNPP